MINNDIEISDSSLDELIDLYRTQSETFFTYETKYFENLNPYYDLSILTKLIKEDIRNAIIRLEESKARLLKTNLGQYPDYWDMTRELEENEGFIIIEEINSSNSTLLKQVSMSKSLINSSMFFGDSADYTDMNFISFSGNDGYRWRLKPKESVPELFNDNIPNARALSKFMLNELKRSHIKTFGKDRFESLSKDFYSFFLKEFEDLTKTKSEIYIAPDPVFSNIPFEALLINDSTYLVEKFDIKYIQSNTILSMLEKRNYLKLERKVLNHWKS